MDRHSSKYQLYMMSYLWKSKRHPIRGTMMPDHRDDAPHPEPQGPQTPPPGEVSPQRLQQLVQETKDAVLERLVTKDGPPKGSHGYPH
jgi:hypothetical protein